MVHAHILQVQVTRRPGFIKAQTAAQRNTAITSLSVSHPIVTAVYGNGQQGLEVTVR